MFDLVVRLYQLHGIELERGGPDATQLVEKGPGAPVLAVGAPIRGAITRIHGRNTKVGSSAWGGGKEGSPAS